MAHIQNEFAGSDSADRAAVARISASLLTAVNAADLAGVVAVWSDDGVLMPPHHPSVRGRPEIERYFSQLFERIEYSMSARAALGGAEAQDVGKGLHVYRRDPNGLWKLAMDIWNSDTPVRS